MASIFQEIDRKLRALGTPPKVAGSTLPQVPTKPPKLLTSFRDLPREERIRITRERAEEAKEKARRAESPLGIIRGTLKSALEEMTGVPSSEELTEKYHTLLNKGKTEEQAKSELKQEVGTRMLESLTLPPPEIKINVKNGIVTAEAPGAVDIFGVAGIAGDVTKKLGRTALNKIAKSTNADEIFKIIKGEVKDISSSLARTLSKRFKDLTSKPQIQREFSARATKEVGTRTVREATKPTISKIKAVDEFKVGDVLDPQGKTNMVGKVTIREIRGNTLKFVDSEGTEFAGMQRSQVRRLVNGGSWKRVGAKVKAPTIPKELEPLAAEARKFKTAEEFVERMTTPEGVVGAYTEGDKRIIEIMRPLVAKVEMPSIDLKPTLTDFYNLAMRGVKPPIKPPIKLPVKPVAPKEVSSKNTIQKLIKAVDEAVPLRGEQKRLYQEELAKRTARVASVGERVAGEKGFFAQLGQLKGPLPKAQFQAIRKQFTQKEVDLLFDTIERAKNLLPLEKVSTKGGLAKLFDGDVPTKREIEHLREVFPADLIDAIRARRPLFQKIKETIGELLNVPRTLMATLDLSAPFRQGVFMIGRPVRFGQAFKDMFKFVVSEKAYVGLMEGIKARPTYLKMKQGGLALTEIGGPLLKREEAFMGALAEKIPGYGVLVRASNRAYTGFLNKLRADIFDDILRKAEVSGVKITDSVLKSIGEFVSAGTGRGKFGLAKTGIIPKSMEKAAVVLNATFFSQRLMASRLNLLNPYFYIQLEPVVRREALKTLFSTTAILSSLYGLWALNGGKVGLDPRNADFAKARTGNTRYDLLGGFQQYIRLAAQLISGEIISSTTGRTITLGEGYKPLTRQDIILRFFEYKTSPIASFVIGLLKGQTAMGEEFDLPTNVINRFIPMAVQDLYDATQEKGAEGIFYGLPAIFGFGVQTYGKQELAVGESKIGEPTAQIRPVPELAEKIRELVLGQIPLGTSRGFSVETYYDQLSQLPREEAAEIFDRIANINPDLAEKLSDVIREREMGITVEDKDLKSKGVASGDRALAIKKELDRRKTPEEKSALWDEYVRKGIITEDVGRQLKILLQEKSSSGYERSVLGLVSDYTKAFATDPQNAFKALFTKEKLGVVKGNLVELQRFYGIRFDDKGGSQEFKRGLMEKEGIPLEEIGEWKLEHITPVKAGGSSAERNLMLVNNEMHNFFTPIDIAVGNAVKEGKITRNIAEELMRKFKVEKTLTAEEVIAELTQ